MPPILAYYSNVVIGDHPGATAISYLTSLGIVILALMRFIFVVECSTVVRKGRDPCTGHGDCGMINPLWSAVQRCIGNQSFVQFDTESPSDHFAAFLEY